MGGKWLGFWLTSEAGLCAGKDGKREHFGFILSSYYQYSISYSIMFLEYIIIFV